MAEDMLDSAAGEILSPILRYDLVRSTRAVGIFGSVDPEWNEALLRIEQQTPLRFSPPRLLGDIGSRCAYLEMNVVRLLNAEPPATLSIVANSSHPAFFIARSAIDIAPETQAAERIPMEERADLSKMKLLAELHTPDDKGRDATSTRPEDVYAYLQQFGTNLRAQPIIRPKSQPSHILIFG